MMLTFEKAMELTRTISSLTAFEDDECRAYFDVLMSLAPDSLIVEVGLEYGRSSSIALQVAKERQLQYTGIDIVKKPEWANMLRCLCEIDDEWYGKHHPVCYWGPGVDTVIPIWLYSWPADPNITAILIDGDHSYEGVMADCEHFLPHVVKGGYAMFHDFERDSLPDVTRAVGDYFDTHYEPGKLSDFEHIEVVGTLGIWRRV